MRLTLPLLFLVLLPAMAMAQTTIWGTNDYIEYQVGTLPVVISVPHGGDLGPAAIPDRTCNDPVFVKDIFTIETALAIKAALFAATGCYPHIIISHLKRTKLDPNRNRTSGACGHPQANTAWDEFHAFIGTAQQAANQDYGGDIFFVDLHGHGNPIPRIELGYLLYDDELALPDATLNTQQYLDASSIKNLALNNTNGYTHAQLLRGAQAFGTLLGLRGFPAVPSQQIPSPGTTTNYFSGGYITANHTCYAPGNTTNGLQMELNFAGIRDTPNARAQFAEAFAAVITDYLSIHTGVAWGGCAPVSTDTPPTTPNPTRIPGLYPNPVAMGGTLQWSGSAATGDAFTITDILGHTLVRGNIDALAPWPIGNTLPAGTYIVTIFPQGTNRTYRTTLVVQ